MKILISAVIILILANAANAQNGAALDFDGINDYVSIPNSNSFNITKVTIETWVKWNNSGTAIDFICGKNYEQLEIHTGGGGGSNGIRFIPAPFVYLDGPSNILPSGIWTHISYVYDPSIALAKLYVNGIEKPLTNHGGNPLTTPIGSSAADFLLGKRSNNSFPFKGNIDEFRIWNRVLTQSEIQSNMNCELSGKKMLLAYYKFNQGSGGSSNAGVTTLFDSSGNNNNATLINFALAGNNSNWVEPGGVQTGMFCATHDYTYIGNGNWSDSVNWINNLVPPPVLTYGTITINPAINGVCILNVLQTINKGAELTIATDKKLIIPGNLILDSSLNNQNGLPSTISYTSFQGVGYILQPWFGEHIVLLTPRSDLDTNVMKKIVKSLDDGYEYYNKVTGREPVKWDRHTINGRGTIASVDVTCGGACGYLGYTGIEMIHPWVTELYDDVKERGVFHTTFFYEEGRNFWFYSNKLDYAANFKMSANTGYSELMKYMSTDYIQLPIRPAEIPTRKHVEDLAGIYLTAIDWNWKKIVETGNAPDGNNQTTAAHLLFASLLLNLQKSYGGHVFIERFLKEAYKRNSTNSIEDAIDNMAIAICAGANANLSNILINQWRIPISQGVRNEAQMRFGNPL